MGPDARTSSSACWTRRSPPLPSNASSTSVWVKTISSLVSWYWATPARCPHPRLVAALPRVVRHDNVSHDHSQHRSFARPSALGKSCPMTPVPVVAPLLRDGVVSLRRTATATRRRSWSSPGPRVRAVDVAPRPYGAEQARAFVSAASRGWARGGNRVWAIEVVDPLSGSRGSPGRSTTARRARRSGPRLRAAPGGPRPRGGGPRRGLALSWAFASDGVEVVHWSAYVGNWASRRTAWRCGSVSRAPSAGSCPRTAGGTTPGLAP